MILIEAEALYWQGQPDEAHDLLYQLQLNRYPEAVQSGNTGEALLEEIFFNNRSSID